MPRLNRGPSENDAGLPRVTRSDASVTRECRDIDAQVKMDNISISTELTAPKDYQEAKVCLLLSKIEVL